MKLLRDSQTEKRTLGVLVDDVGTVLAQTLEPPPNHAIKDRCCIPSGRYTCRLRYSPSHGYAVYGYLKVPGFSDVEIHPGNDVYDTKACTLIGNARGQLVIAGEQVDAVLNSRVTFDAFMSARGVPNYKALRDWDAVRDFLEAHPAAAEFPVEVVDPPGL